MSAYTTTSEESLWARHCAHCREVFTHRLFVTCECATRFYCAQDCKIEDAKTHNEICASSNPNSGSAIEERTRRENLIRIVNQNYRDAIVTSAVDSMLAILWGDLQHNLPLPPFSSIDWNDLFSKYYLTVHMTYCPYDMSHIPPALIDLIPALDGPCEGYIFDIHREGPAIVSITSIDALEPPVVSRIRNEYLAKAPAIVVGFSMSKSVGPFSTTRSTPFIIPYVHRIEEDVLFTVYREMCKEIVERIGAGEDST